MIKQWFTAADLAEMKLPDMPAGRTAVADKARLEDWARRRNQAGDPLARKRRGRGGGWEYHHSILPPRAQIKLARDLKPAPAADDRKAAKKTLERSEIWEWFDRQPHSKKARAQTKLDALTAIKQLTKGGLTLNVAVHEVAASVGKSARTLFNWLDEVAGVEQSDWLAHLCPRHAGRTKTVACHPAAWDVLRVDYLRAERPRFSDCYRRLESIAADRGWLIPAERTLWRRIKHEIPREVRVYHRQGLDALKRLYPPQERDRTVFHALEAVNIDGHVWDVFVKWPGRDKPVRPMMVAIQDLYSNKILGWRVDTSENTDSIRLTFMDVFKKFGIPDHVYLDNGRAFASKYISGGAPTRYRFKVKAEEPVGILTALNIDIHWTTPYSGQSKPIERAFKDLCNEVAKHPAFAGAYTGNTIDAKPENYGSSAVDLDLFLAVVERGINEYNARLKRNTRVCGRVKSFDQAYEESAEKAMIRRATDEQLRFCMLAAEGVKANPQSGSVMLLGNRYWDQALVEHAGKPLTVRFDPDDLHAGVRVYRQDGVFVAFAECLDPAGFNDAEVGRRHARARSAYMKKTKELAALEKRLSLKELVGMIPDLEEPTAPQSKVTRMVTLGATALAPKFSEIPDPAETEFDRMFSDGLAVIEGGLSD